MEHHVTDATRANNTPDAGAGRAYAGVLAECRELIRGRACAALADSRAALDEDIKERIISALDPDEEKMLADLRGQLRNQGESLERSFASAFDHSFGELSRKRQGAASNLYQIRQRRNPRQTSCRICNAAPGLSCAWSRASAVRYASPGSARLTPRLSSNIVTAWWRKES